MSSTGPGCELKDTPLACNRNVRSDYLMCRNHWYQVPYDIRQRVYATLEAGGVLDGDYQAAVDDAVKAVLERNNIAV